MMTIGFLHSSLAEEVEAFRVEVVSRVVPLVEALLAEEAQEIVGKL